MNFNKTKTISKVNNIFSSIGDLFTFEPIKLTKFERKNYMNDNNDYLNFIPSTETLQNFDRAVQNGGKEIINLSHKKLDNETKVIESISSNSKREYMINKLKLDYVFLLVALSLILATILAILNHESVSLMICGTTIGAIIASVYAKYNSNPTE